MIQKMASNISANKYYGGSDQFSIFPPLSIENKTAPQQFFQSTFWYIKKIGGNPQRVRNLQNNIQAREPSVLILLTIVDLFLKLRFFKGLIDGLL